MKVGIFILNYNGSGLLRLCLPSIVEAAARSRYQCEVVVVDNRSVDDSRDLVAAEFPGVGFRVMKENRVLCSFNEVARDSDADKIILLNNDLVVDKNFIDPLIGIFSEKENVFLSAARVYNFDGTELEEGRTKAIVKWGSLKGISKYKGYENELENIDYTFQAGFGAFDRKKFLELDGYDPLYLPGILEDTDICFRAWRSGYKCFYQPRSHIYHIGKASFKKRFGNRKLLAISHRNTYFFMWKNITDKKMLFMNIFFAAPRMFYALVTMKWEIIWGFLWFLQRIPDVLKRRKQEFENRGCYIKGDKEVLGLFG